MGGLGFANGLPTFFQAVVHVSVVIQHHPCLLRVFSRWRRARRGRVQRQAVVGVQHYRFTETAAAVGVGVGGGGVDYLVTLDFLIQKNTAFFFFFC